MASELDMFLRLTCPSDLREEILPYTSKPLNRQHLNYLRDRGYQKRVLANIERYKKTEKQVHTALGESLQLLGSYMCRFGLSNLALYGTLLLIFPLMQWLLYMGQKSKWRHVSVSFMVGVNTSIYMIKFVILIIHITHKVWTVFHKPILPQLDYHQLMYYGKHFVWTVFHMQMYNKLVDDLLKNLIK